MKTTFTLEAIAGFDSTRLGELVKDRVGKGVRTFEIVTLDEAIGRMAAMGVRVVGDVPVVEVESFPRLECHDCGAVVETAECRLCAGSVVIVAEPDREEVASASG